MLVNLEIFHNIAWCTYSVSIYYPVIDSFGSFSPSLFFLLMYLLLPGDILLKMIARNGLYQTKILPIFWDLQTIFMLSIYVKYMWMELLNMCVNHTYMQLSVAHVAYHIKSRMNNVFLATIIQPYLVVLKLFQDIWHMIWYFIYLQASNIRRTWESNKIVDHSDVVGASPVGDAPTTSSLST